MNLRERLLEIAKERPNVVKPRIEQGDRVSLNVYEGSTSYTVDSADLHRRWDFESDDDFYLALSRDLGSRDPRYVELFPPGNMEGVPLSRALDMDVGECVEKAVLVQQRKQDLTPTFYIIGLMGHKAVPRSWIHSYNIVFQGDSPFLVDAENPVIVRVEGRKIELPYVVPVAGLDGDQFVIEKKSAGRSYSIAGQAKGRASILSMF